MSAARTSTRLADTPGVTEDPRGVPMQQPGITGGNKGYRNKVRMAQNAMLAAWADGLGPRIASLYIAENERRARTLMSPVVGGLDPSPLPLGQRTLRLPQQEWFKRPRTDLSSTAYLGA